MRNSHVITISHSDMALIQKAREKAASRRQSFSAYIMTLVEADMEGGLEALSESVRAIQQKLQEALAKLDGKSRKESKNKKQP